MANVTFKIGEVVQGWTIKSKNGLSEYVAENAEGIILCFRTDAGEGTNYSQVQWYTKNGRQYRAGRYLLKYVSLVQSLSNVLFDRYYEENMEMFTEEDVEPLEEGQDITHKWVVIKPKLMFQNYKPEYITKEHQVVFATGGFGCKGAALSWGGGKVFCNDTTGLQAHPHRVNILGIAKPHVLMEMDIPSTCPKCRKDSVLDALSRDNDTMICSKCAQSEAMEELFG